MIEEASETFIGTLRTVARVFGTLTAITLLIELVVKLRSLLGFAPLVLILSFSAYLIIFAGFLAGWKSDRFAALLIIGGLALAVGVELFLSRRVCSRPIYLISIVIGLLYLYTWSRDGR
jgi:hypothetical protein